jgi:hypothetical protein
MLVHQQLPLELLLAPQLLALLPLLIQVDPQSCSPRPVHVATRQPLELLLVLLLLLVQQVLALLLLLMMLIMMHRNDRK